MLLYYTHTAGAFVIAAQALYMLLLSLWQRRIPRRWLVSQAVIGLAIGISLVGTLGGIGRAMEIISKPSLLRPIDTMMMYVVEDWRSLSGITIGAALIFWMLGTLLFARWQGRTRWLAAMRDLVPAVRTIFTHKRRDLLLVGCWLLGPIMIPFVLSFVLEPMYRHRYTISASPALYLLLALAMTTVQRVIPQLVSLGAVAILVVPGLHSYYTTEINEPWRDLAAHIEERDQPGDVIVLGPDHQRGWWRKALEWYYHGDLPRCTIDTPGKEDAAVAAAFGRCTAGYQRVWLVLRDNPAWPPPHYLRTYFLGRDHPDMRLITGEEFAYRNGMLSVYLFELQR